MLAARPTLMLTAHAQLVEARESRDIDMLRQVQKQVLDPRGDRVTAVVLMVECAEAAVEMRCPDLAVPCLRSFFSQTREKDQFYIRALYAQSCVVAQQQCPSAQDAFGALEGVQEGMTLAQSTQRYSFLVFNGSIHMWSLYRFLFRDAVYKRLLAPTQFVVKALDDLPSTPELITWRIRWLGVLAKCQEHSGKQDDAAKTAASAAATAYKASLTSLHRDLFRYQVQLLRSNAAAVAKLRQETGSDVILRAIYVVQLYSGLAVGDPGAPASSEPVLAEVRDALTGLANAHNKTDADAATVELGSIALAWDDIDLADQCAHTGVTSPHLLPRVQGEFLAVEVAIRRLDVPDPKCTTKQQQRRSLLLTKRNIKVRTDMLQRLIRALPSAVRLDAPSLVQDAAVLIWNTALPLLQANLRHHAKRALQKAADALRQIASPMRHLRALLLLELARCEVADDLLAKAKANVAAALQLDASLEGEPGPLAAQLQPLRRTLELRTDIYAEVTKPEDEARLMLLQASDSKDSSVKTLFYTKCVQLLDSANIEHAELLAAVAKAAWSERLLEPTQAAIKRFQAHMLLIDEAAAAARDAAFAAAAPQAAPPRRRRGSVAAGSGAGATATAAAAAGAASRPNTAPATDAAVRAQERSVAIAAAELSFILAETYAVQLRDAGFDLSDAIGEDVDPTPPASAPLHTTLDEVPEEETGAMHDTSGNEADQQQEPQPVQQQQEPSADQDGMLPEERELLQQLRQLQVDAMMAFARGLNMAQRLQDDTLTMNGVVYVYNHVLPCLRNGQHVLVVELLDLAMRAMLTVTSKDLTMLCDLAHALIQGLLDRAAGKDDGSWTVPAALAGLLAAVSATTSTALSIAPQPSKRGRGSVAGGGAASSAAAGAADGAGNGGDAGESTCLLMNYANTDAAADLKRAEEVGVSVNTLVTQCSLKQHVVALLVRVQHARGTLKPADASHAASPELAVILALEVVRLTDAAKASSSRDQLTRAATQLRETGSTTLLTASLWQQVQEQALRINDLSLCLDAGKTVLEQTQAYRLESRRETVQFQALLARCELVQSKGFLALIVPGEQDKSCQDRLRLQAVHHACRAVCLSCDYLLQLPTSQQAANAHDTIAAAHVFHIAAVPFATSALARKQLLQPLRMVVSRMSTVTVLQPNGGDEHNNEGSDAGGSAVNAEFGTVLASLYDLLLRCFQDAQEWEAGLDFVNAAFDTLGERHAKALLEAKVIFMCRMSRDVAPILLRAKEFDASAQAQLFLAIARNRDDRGTQWSAYQQALTLLEDSPRERVDSLLEFGEWLFANGFALQDAQLHLEEAADILLDIELSSQPARYAETVGAAPVLAATSSGPQHQRLLGAAIVPTVATDVPVATGSGGTTARSGAVTARAAAATAAGGMTSRTAQAGRAALLSNRLKGDMKTARGPRGGASGSSANLKATIAAAGASTGGQGGGVGNDSDVALDARLDVQQLEVLTRVYLMLAEMHPARVDYCFMAQFYILRIWETTFATINTNALPPGATVASLGACSSVTYRMPQTHQEWLGYQVPSATLAALRRPDATNSRFAVSPVSMPKPLLTLHYLLKLCDSLQQHGFHTYCAPVLQLARLLAHLVVSSPSLQALVDLRLARLYDELELPGSAAIHIELAMAHVIPTDLELREHDELLQQHAALVNRSGEEDTQAHQLPPARIEAWVKAKQNAADDGATIGQGGEAGFAARHVWQQMASLLIDGARFQPARILLRHAQRHASVYRDTQCLAWCMFEHGRIAALEGDLASAIKHVQEARAAAPRASLEFWSRSSAFLAESQMQLNQLVAASATLDEAITTISQVRSAHSNYAPQIARSHASLATLQSEMLLRQADAARLIGRPFRPLLQQADSCLQAAQEAVRAIASGPAMMKQMLEMARLVLLRPAVRPAHLRVTERLLRHAERAGHVCLSILTSEVGGMASVSEPTARLLAQVKIEQAHILLRLHDDSVAEAAAAPGQVAAGDRAASTTTRSSEGSGQGDGIVPEHVLQRHFGEAPGRKPRACNITRLSRMLLLLSDAENLTRAKRVAAVIQQLKGAALRRQAEAAGQGQALQRWPSPAPYVTPAASPEVAETASTSSTRLTSSASTQPPAMPAEAQRILSEAFAASHAALTQALAVDAFDAAADACLDIVAGLGGADAMRSAMYLMLGQSCSAAQRLTNVFQQAAGAQLRERLQLQLYSTLSKAESATQRTQRPRDALRTMLESSSLVWQHVQPIARSEEEFAQVFVKVVPSGTRVCSLQLSSDRRVLFLASVDGASGESVVVRQVVDPAGVTALQSRARALSASIESTMLRVSRLAPELRQRERKAAANAAAGGIVVGALRRTSSTSSMRSVVSRSSRGSRRSKKRRGVSPIGDGALEVEPDADARSLRAIHEEMEQQLLGPLLSSVLRGTPASAASRVVLLLDQRLETLPWESMPLLANAAAVTRDFSLTQLVRRVRKTSLTAPHTQAIPRSAVRYVCGPRCGVSDVLAGLFKTHVLDATQPASKWTGVLASDHTASTGEWQHHMQADRAFLYAGLGAMLASIRPEAIAGLDLRNTAMMLVMGGVINDTGHRLRTKEDMDKPAVRKMLEDPWHTAALLTLRGCGSLAVNQWACDAESNIQRIAAIVGQLGAGADLAAAMAKLRDQRDLQSYQQSNALVYGFAQARLDKS